MNTNWNDKAFRNEITVEWRGREIDHNGTIYSFDHVPAWIDIDGNLHTPGTLAFKPLFSAGEELHLTLDQAEARAIN